MSKKGLIYKKLNAERNNDILTVLRKKMYIAVTTDDMEFERDKIMQQVENMKICAGKFDSLDTENMIFYLNYNSNFATKGFRDRKYEDRLVVLNRLLTLDLTKHENILLMADFINWSTGMIYEDKDMSKLVQYFCDNVTVNQSNLLFEMHSILQTGMQDRCKEIVKKKMQELKNTRNNRNNEKTVDKSKKVC